MSWSGQMGRFAGFKGTRLQNCLDNKLVLKLSGQTELSDWFWLDGQRQFKVTIPKGHSSEIDDVTMRKIANQLRLGAEELRNLYQCPMSGKEYATTVRSRLAT